MKNGFAVIEQNQEHLDSGKKANEFRHSKNFDFKDDYFKSEKNARERKYENIRQEVSNLRRLPFIVEQYEERGDYGVTNINGKEVGEVEQGRNDIEDIINKIALYSVENSDGAIDTDISYLIEEIIKHTKEFETKLDGVLVYAEASDEELTKKFSSPIEVVNEILNVDGSTLVDDLVNKYGKDYYFTSNCQDWRLWFYKKDFRKLLEKRIKDFEKKQSDESVKKRIVEFSDATTESGRALENFDSLDLQTIIQNTKKYSGLVTTYMPDYEKTKTQASRDMLNSNTRKLLDKLMLKFQGEPTLFENTDNAQIKDLINVFSENEKTLLLRLFIKNCSIEKLTSFVSSDLEGYYPEDVSFDFLQMVEHKDLSSEQQDAIQEALFQVGLSQLPKLFGGMEIQNTVRYLLISRVLVIQEKTNKENFVQMRDKIIMNLPSGIQFAIQHERQMETYYLFLKSLTKSLFEESNTGADVQLKLLSLLSNRDSRYPQINQKFDSLKNELQGKFQSL